MLVDYSGCKKWDDWYNNIIMSKIIECFKEVQLPEKFYEACVTCSIITYFKEKRGETVYPFAVSPVKESWEGYDFGYEMNNDIFLLQYKRPQKNGKGYRWNIDIKQLEVIINNTYGKVTYYVFPQFEDYKLWYQALENVKFIDAITLKKYLEKTGKKSVNSEWKELKGWEEVVYELFGKNSYKSALEVNCSEYKKELLKLLQIDGVVGYEIK